ncbi:MAG: hypothetical protein K6T63_10380 [Alicyclobacillus herbarius]|uniref:hypothetical protein n=1 Tax=Alicyclobacillus herbarius TaxID=122960 RepID=UPI0023574EA3|nr:hypothetical protein [Alicyclobacillus herbarius]MCL6633026.1 hypothetical protein [Alicyclobacillus herbarius]
MDASWLSLLTLFPVFFGLGLHLWHSHRRVPAHVTALQTKYDWRPYPSDYSMEIRPILRMLRAVRRKLAGSGDDEPPLTMAGHTALV